MARSGLSEAVEASSGAPEKRCLQTPREHEAASHKPTGLTLRRRFAEERLAARKSDFEKNHPGRSDRKVRFSRTLSKKEMNRKRQGETQGSIERSRVATRVSGYGLASGEKP